MKLTKENILKRASTYEILNHFLAPYTGGKKLRKDEHILSPLAAEKTPSFNIYPDKKDRNNWLWYDHGRGEGGNCFDLVIALYNGCDFRQALELINRELLLGLGETSAKLPERKKVEPPPAPKITKKWFEITASDWRPADLEWWGQYGITKITLDLFGVQSLEAFSSISRKDKPFTIFRRGSEYIFTYKIAEDAWKVYRPEFPDKRFKFSWLGTKPADYVFGFDQLPETGELVFFTGGEKDVMTLHAFGYPAISLNSETALPSPELIEKLRARFSRVIVLYDNDKTGQSQSKKLKAERGLDFITLPEFEGKDISDWAKFRQNKKVIKVLLDALGGDSPAPAKTDNSPPPKPSAAKPLPVPVVALEKDQSWENYKAVLQSFKLPDNPDFTETNGGKIKASYLEMTGQAYRVSVANQARPASNVVGLSSRMNAVYLPPLMRFEDANKKKVSKDLTGDILYICQDEITAYVISSLGVPAVAIPHPAAFLSRPKQKTPHKLLKQVIKAHGIKHLVYFMPPSWFALPKSQATEDKNPYANQDAAENANNGLAALLALHEAFKLMPSNAIFPSSFEPNFFTRKYYVLELLVSLATNPEFSEKSREAFSSRDFGALFLNDESEYFNISPVSTGTQFTFREALHLSTAEAFLEFHGLEALGYVFQWGKNIYQYDPSAGSLDLAGNSRDAYNIRQKDGRFYGQARGGGEKAISDFTMKYHLEVKQEDTFYLVEFIPILGAPQFAVFHISDIINADIFKKKVADIPGSKFNFWGSKNEIEQIHAMLRAGVKEAKSLENVLGYSKNGFYVFGNGILLETGEFKEADEFGLVQIGDERFYLPAMARFNESSQDYDAERDFCFEASGVDFREWVKLFIQVHSWPGHIVLAFVISSLYRDIFREIGYETFPHVSIVAPPESGKTSLANSVSRFFGRLKQTNLRAGATRASFDRKIELYNNAVLIINEFNLSNKQVQKERLEEYLVGVYDYQAREKTVRGKARQAVPNSAVLVIGQESFWHKEALASRCIIQELEAKKVRTEAETDRYNELKDLVSEGISFFHSLFMPNRALIREKIRPQVETLIKEFKRAQERPVTARVIENYAIALAPLLLLQSEGKISYPVAREKIINHAKRSIAIQANKMIAEGVLSIFFNFISSEYGPRKLLTHQEVWLYRKKNELRIKLEGCYKAFLSYINREGYGIENTTKNDMLGRLKSHPAFLEEKKGIQVGWKKNEAGFISTDIGQRPIPAKSGSLVVVLNPELIEDFSLPEIEWHRLGEISNETESEPIPA